LLLAIPTIRVNVHIFIPIIFIFCTITILHHWLWSRCLQFPQLQLGPSHFSFLLLCKNPFPLPQVQLFVVSHSPVLG
ncbi:hypothetical protein PAXRUDRAFT_770024, partial [Paxillus rubicundulus Ve08.2h10]